MVIMNNSTNKIIGLSVLLIGLISGVALTEINQNISEKASPATSLFITPNYQEVRIGNTFANTITVDSGENKITGLDLIFSYDPSAINITEVKATSDISNFNTVLKNEIDNTNGKLRYTTFSFDRNLAISGKVNILTIYGKVMSSSTLNSYDIKIDDDSIITAVSEGQNVLASISNSTIKVIEEEPNSCGGTCGSNNNCKSNYYCFEGFCRNPVCPSDSNCNCIIAATTTPKVTAKPAVVKTAKPTVAASETPGATRRPISTSDPIIVFSTTEPNTLTTTTDLKNQIWTDFVKYLLGLITFVIVCVLIFIGVKNHNKNIKHILPPTNI